MGSLLIQTGCDLQPKVLSFPDSVGDFISARYPALLADPNVYPEIYNSAATDYGVYAAPEMYGTYSGNDYVMYASVDDYIIPPQVADVDKGTEFIDEKQIATETKNVASVDDYILVPEYNGDVAQNADVKSDDVLTINKPNIGAQKTTRVELIDVVVAPGDTLYSLSRKYSVPVNDLAVMNKLTAPFYLKVGQKVRVPNLRRIEVERVGESKILVADNKQEINVQPKPQQKKSDVQGGTTNNVQRVDTKPVKKISSDPTKKLPKINARSSSKFSWPVRGRILSNYGAKSGGLFNDGINIGAVHGTLVKAAENGVVAYAGNEVKGMGNLVIVQHEDGWMTVYAHMGTMDVRRGARVSVGQKIGTVGKTGKVDEPQLHFEIRKGTKAYNPIQYLKK